MTNGIWHYDWQIINAGLKRPIPEPRAKGMAEVVEPLA
jgi:hypothetical protein